jgi:uncharacterized membrane protein YsdA (DUF1294 family)
MRACYRNGDVDGVRQRTRCRIASLPRPTQNPAVGKPLWYVVLAINLLAFLVCGYDKLCARNGWRRVPEARLLALAFFGGCIGTWFAMSVFRHKTRKTSFRWRLLLLTVLNPLWLLLWLLCR